MFVILSAGREAAEVEGPAVVAQRSSRERITPDERLYIQNWRPPEL
jgi:hypothetical protein